MFGIRKKLVATLAVCGFIFSGVANAALISWDITGVLEESNLGANSSLGQLNDTFTVNISFDSSAAIIRDQSATSRQRVWLDTTSLVLSVIIGGTDFGSFTGSSRGWPFGFTEDGSLAIFRDDSTDSVLNDPAQNQGKTEGTVDGITFEVGGNDVGSHQVTFNFRTNFLAAFINGDLSTFDIDNFDFTNTTTNQFRFASNSNTSDVVSGRIVSGSSAASVSAPQTFGLFLGTFLALAAVRRKKNS